MKVKFETMVDGINRYIAKEIYGKLNSVQEFFARVVIGRLNQNADTIKKELMHNGFAKTLGLVDSDGNVNIDEIIQSIKKELERKECLKVEIPLMGSITFKPEDADNLYREIVGEDEYENY